MQIEQYIIVTSTDEIAALQRHIGVHELNGQINLTIKGNDIEVWQPSKEAIVSFTSLNISKNSSILSG